MGQSLSELSLEIVQKSGIKSQIVQTQARELSIHTSGSSTNEKGT
jgi:hypothetical protein